MPASDFADLIISEMKSAIGQNGENFTKDTPNIANKTIAKAITTYLLNNTTVSVSYSGIIPGTPPVPDPTVTDVLRITGECKVPGVSDNFDSWVSEIGSNIQNGFFLENGLAGVTTTSPNSILCFDGTPLSIKRDEIKSIHEGNFNDPQKAVWEFICERIITWLSNISGIPFPGKNINSESQGEGTVVKIIVI